MNRIQMGRTSQEVDLLASGICFAKRQSFVRGYPRLCGERNVVVWAERVAFQFSDRALPAWRGRNCGNPLVFLLRLSILNMPILNST